MTGMSHHHRPYSPILASPFCQRPSQGSWAARFSNYPIFASPLFRSCKKMANTKSQMEKHLDTVNNVFHHYSVRLGHPDTLNKKEVKQLVQKELPNFLKKENKDDKEINEIMEDLDTNQDDTLDFDEFVILVARVSNTFHEEMHKNAHG
ncbi:protein S100-A9-like [Perognathus longimembris pacificus]|uniref:protein S100-A9-like n=1 Tax=Perognathus longimembris pacificus TaxID=214514 RepID=UPI002019CCF7|nr:protein S100-A9-like [Perognathus longimembris pacificus]XP_048193135.1 protein S100-A9-like [Perognathus longimembris pacificus]XP_048193137.1 protein S100-A9-like [Perognathus longimembris pacificus]XP_048213947.1 protein S100-A9-like [Perognathus longimembris pacificus]XP_048213948.1 protein S100-A9-like [Perognathus longimembris pacificus]